MDSFVTFSIAIFILLAGVSLLIYSVGVASKR